MTTLDRPRSAPDTTWRPRSDAELLRDQVSAIDAWHALRRAGDVQEGTAASAAASREMRLDLSRRRDVLRREHEAILARTQQHLEAGSHVMRSSRSPRALIAHRNAWYAGKLAGGLSAAGIEVVGIVANGADAVGIAVVEQPDVVLVEDKLEMLSGEQVVRQVVELCPRTIVVAQVAVDDGLAALLDAGARTAFTRRVPPADVARDLGAMLVRPSL